MSDLPASLTAPQIRRRANDYDAQIRQGLEDGNVRQVVKRLGKDLTELLTLRVNGTQEQRAAFPKPLFLYVFVRGWNKNKNDANFLDAQLAILKEFDENQQSPPPLPASTSLPIPTVPAPQAPSRPRPQKAKFATPPPAVRVIGPRAPSPPRPLPAARPTRAATPPPARHGKAPRTRSPSITPPPARTTRVATPPPPRHGKAPQRRSPPPSPPPAPGPSRSRKVVVEMPPRSPIKFQDINDDDDEYSPESPPPPTPKRQREPEPTIVELEVFKMSCDKCQRGGRDCVPVVGNGDACRACKEKKYKCSHRGVTDLKTMRVIRPAIRSGSEVQVVEDTKGKKRKAESPVPARERKAKGEAVKVKVEKVEKPKPRAKPTKAKVEKPREQRAKASGAKPPAKRRPPPKSSQLVDDSSSPEEFMEIDDDDDDDDEVEVEVIEKEPMPKRARTRARIEPEHEKRLAALEERVNTLDKVAEETTRTSRRVDAIEGSVTRFTGALETFLGRIHIDDRLRLVPDHMRLTSPPLLPTTRSASPATPMDLPMDEDEDTGPDLSSVAGTRTTPSDHQVERMEVPIPSGSGSVLPPDTTLLAAPPLPASPRPSPIAAPTITLIPATPQGSQQVEKPGPTPTPAVPPSVPSPLTAINEDPLPPPPPVIRSRSRTPAAALLGVESRATRARSRSKTPI